MSKDKYIQIRVSGVDKEKIKKIAKASGKSISQLFLDSVLTNNNNVNTNVNTKDISILIKMLKPFVEKGIKIDLENEEIERIKQLWSDVKDA